MLLNSEVRRDARLRRRREGILRPFEKMSWQPKPSRGKSIMRVPPAPDLQSRYGTIGCPQKRCEPDNAKPQITFLRVRDDRDSGRDT